MKEWMKTLVGAICILTVLLNLVPNGKFEKYVRFYAGLLFFLIAVTPILHWFGKAGSLERLLQIEFLKEDYEELEAVVAGMDELKNDQIRAACQQEILRQVEQIASAYGSPAKEVQVFFDSDGYTPTDAALCLGNGTDENHLAEAAAEIRREISAVYGIENSRIQITEPGGRQL